MNLWVRVLKEFGYHDTHKDGEILKIPVKDINELIKLGYIEILVNNNGDNLPYDEDSDLILNNDDCIEVEF